MKDTITVFNLLHCHLLVMLALLCLLQIQAPLIDPRPTPELEDILIDAERLQTNSKSQQQAFLLSVATSRHISRQEIGSRCELYRGEFVNHMPVKSRQWHSTP